MDFRLTVFVLIGVFGVYADQQVYCPNNGEPKRNDAGELIQCLPGQESICGKGHSCFFSGFNYQCCPSNDESEEVAADCPESTITVLNSNGSPIRCSSLGKSCPQSNMFCHEDTAVPICCQRLGPITTPMPEHKRLELQAAEEFFKEDDNESQSVDVECPNESLMVLSDEGNPIICRDDSPCPQSGMFCHGNSQKICCEATLTAFASEPQQTQNTTSIQNQLQYTPKESETAVTIGAQLKTIANLTQNVHTDDSTTSYPPTTTINSKKYTLSAAGPQQLAKKAEKFALHPKALAARTARVNQNAKPTEEYQPHTFGGYAVSRTFNSMNPASHVDKKEIVQHYLLEQIKQGWPYDEKFFRPENTAIVRDGRRQTSIVHFP